MLVRLQFALRLIFTASFRKLSCGPSAQ